VLLQLPPQFRADRGRLEATLDRFPEEFRTAVEFRHETWFRDEIRRVLVDRNVALCLADRRGVLGPIWRTADWTYLRFHEGRSRDRPRYGQASLQTWAERLADGWPASADVFVYFNNDHRACALANAGTFARLAAERGRAVSRTPDPRSIAVG